MMKMMMKNNMIVTGKNFAYLSQFAKLVAILVVLFASVNLLSAQKYVRIKKDFGDDVRFFKGEIYEYDSITKEFIVNEKRYKITKQNVELYPNAKQLTNTDKFITKSIDKQYIHVDLSSVQNDNDTIWLADATKKIIPIVTKKNVKVESGKLGNVFRLIIPNTVTVWYGKSELKKDKNGVSLWWIYVIVAVLFLAIIVRNRKALWSIIKPKNVPIKDNGQSHSSTNSSQYHQLYNAWLTEKNRNDALERQQRDKEATITQLRNEKEKLATEKAQLEKQLNNIKVEISRLQTEKDWDNLVSKKVISVEFFRNDAEIVCAYFDYCKEVELKAGNYYDKIGLRNDSNIAVIACLLQNFRNSICDIPVGEWMQIVKDIKDTGISANRQVIRVLTQPENDNEKRRELRKTLFREVIVRYSSNILVLAESFRHLARLGIDADEAVSEFKRYVDGIVSKAKTIDMEIKYVPLFEKYDKYSAIVESTNKSKSFPYSEVRDLERDDIAEIISYGVKTEFEDIKTQIIIE
jgi:hypothetical protein